MAPGPVGRGDEDVGLTLVERFSIEAEPDVTDRHVGQRVVIEPNIACLACPACRSGVTSDCTQREILGMNYPGILAERVAVPAEFTWTVPDHWPDAVLACFEPVAVARSAASCSWRSRAPARLW